MTGDIVLAILIVSIIVVTDYGFYLLGKRAGAEEAWRTIKETHQAIRATEEKREK
jgi:Tfp pilus assembly protein PilO